MGNNTKKRLKGGTTSRVTARAVRREPPNLPQLAAAIIALAVAQSERDTTARRDAHVAAETAGDAA